MRAACLRKDEDIPGLLRSRTAPHASHRLRCLTVDLRKGENVHHEPQRLMHKHPQALRRATQPKARETSEMIDPLITDTPKSALTAGLVGTIRKSGSRGAEKFAPLHTLKVLPETRRLRENCQNLD